MTDRELSRGVRRPSPTFGAGRRPFVHAILGAALAAIAIAGCSSAKLPTHTADVAAYSSQYQTGTQGLVAAGVFADFYDRYADCTKSSSGTCAVFVCPAQRPAPPEAPAAGILTFSGTRESIVLATPYLYDPPAVQRTQFPAGATLTLKGSGGATIPAFTATVLGGPSLRLTSPLLDGVTTLPVARGSTLELTWEAGTFGEIVAHIDEDTTDSRIEVECRFPATAGKGSVSTIPFSVGPGQLDVRGESRTTVDSGDYRITFRAFTTALTPSGDRTRVAIDLQ
ncbi:hypothetical protein BH09MYX1_BH09MYX1_62990 [soil metagenome]